MGSLGGAGDTDRVRGRLPREVEVVVALGVGAEVDDLAVVALVLSVEVGWVAGVAVILLVGRCNFSGMDWRYWCHLAMLCASEGLASDKQSCRTSLVLLLPSFSAMASGSSPPEMQLTTNQG